MNCERIVLSDGLAELEVVAGLGAGIARYDRLAPDGREPLFRPAPGDATDPFALGCNLLVPWSNRISGGGFAFDGRFHPLEPNLPPEPFPIHGNGFAIPWLPVAVADHEVRLALDSDGPGPFRYRAEVRFALEDGALAVSLAARNTAPMALPYGLGLHPWLPRTAGTQLLAPAEAVWLEDARHLPLAKVSIGQRPDWDFRRAKALPKDWINNAFVAWSGSATILWPERGLALDIAADPILSTCIVYSPGEQSDFFCFEPVSHPVDAHNLPGSPEANGLTILRPGETVAAACRFSPRAAPPDP